MMKDRNYTALRRAVVTYLLIDIRTVIDDD